MTPVSLTIKGFLSFRDEFTFYFPDKPGLYYLRGDNRKEPRLGANGAGKSTLWAALYWLCFETTPKGLRAGNVANWETGKGAEVVFIYEHDEKTWAVRRTWGPNSWTMLIDYQGPDTHDHEVIDLTKSADNPFLNHLRLGPSSFLHCILMAQRKEMFLDLKPEAKVSVLSDVLNLDTWIERSVKANKKATEQDAKTRLLEQRVADLSGQLKTFTETDYTQRAQSWETERTKRINSIADAHQKGSEDEKAQITLVDNTRIKLDSIRVKTTNLKRDLVELIDKYTQAQRVMQQAELEVKQSNEHILKLAKQIEAGGVTVCPTCHQTLDLGKSAQHLNHLKEERFKEQTHNKTLNASYSKASDLMRAAFVVKDDMERQVALQNGLLMDEERNFAQHSNKLQYLKRDLDRLEDEAERIENEVNPFTELQNKQQETRIELEQRLQDAKQELDNSTSAYELLSLWGKGFKEIRLFDMASALTELEVEVNSSVSELGLQDWSISFALDRETAKGDVKRGFSVFVQAPGNKRPVPWEVWSGGESQRLRLAGTMGLSDLVRSQSGCTLPLEVWDEPTDGMSPQGINDLLASLKDRAQREQRQIWVVDHHALGYGAFDGVFTVVKDENGSQIIQE